MDDERNKKLAAGRDRLAKFQKKKKKKKKDPKPESSKPNRDSTLDSTPSFIEENTNAGDSLDEFSAGSSDLLGSNSDILSSFSEIDQRSIGTDDLCQDSDTSQLDAEVARVELAESRSRIHQLEESLLGKQTALDLLQNELTQMRATVNNNTDNEGTTTSENINKNQEPSGNVSGQEAELRAALEQYNIKIQEFQQALLQRDQVIQQLTVNMQTVVQSRDAVQAEATAQTNQLSQYIQTLQDQLKETGEALRNQSGEQMSSLADELSMAQSQVTALQQNVADKDATMQQLAERYAQKAQELIELSEDREELKRKNMGEISALQQKLRETTGEDSPMTKDQTLMNLQAELDESYGSQIVMMKQQLEEKRRQEVDLWKQRYDEMERIAAASSDSNLMRTELENQLKEANEKLKAKDEAIMTARGNVDNLNQKLSNVSAAYQKQLDDLKASHANEIEFVAEQAQKRTGEYIDELKKELESTQDELNTSLTDLEEEKKKVGEAVEELAENALNSSSLRGNLTKEIGILAAEIQRKDEEIQELNQVRINLQDQLNIVASDKEEQVSTYQSQINDLSTEYSHLQKELEQVKEGKEAATVDEDALRNEIEEELRSEYEDRIDDLNFAHEGMLQQVRRELHIEHQEALKKEKRELETQFEQKLENITVTKQHEFVTELQKVKSEIQMQYEKEFEEKLEKENAKWLEASPGPFGGGEQEGRADLSRLRAEVQELSEARDALLTQVDSTNHEKEVLEEELLQVMSEKETLVELPFSPKELGFFSTSQEEDEEVKREVESLRKLLEDAYEDKKKLEQKLEQLKEIHAAKLAATESEKQGFVEQLDEMQPQLEMIKDTIKTKEILESITKHRNQLLTDKEELQHRLESQEKEFEGKMLELLMEKETSEGEMDRLKKELEEAREKESSETSPKIGELAETLSELARLQGKAGKVEILEEELEVLRCKLHELEDQVNKEDGSDSDRLEVMQDELQSHQHMVSTLTEQLRVSQEELEEFRSQGNELAQKECKIDALQKELLSLQRENVGLLEEKENLAKDLDEKDHEFNIKLDNLKGTIDELEERNKILANEAGCVEILQREKQQSEEKVDYLSEEVKRLKDDITGKDLKLQEINDRNLVLETEINEMKNGSLREEDEPEVVGKGAVEEDGINMDGMEGGESRDREGCESNDKERLKQTIEDLQCEVKTLKDLIGDKENQINNWRDESEGRGSEIQKLENVIEEMKVMSEEGRTRECDLQESARRLEAALAERKNEICVVRVEMTGLEDRLDGLSKLEEERKQLLERVKGLEQKLEDEHSLEDALAKVERERDSYLERNRILEQEFESEKDKIEAIIQKTFSETDVEGMIGSIEDYHDSIEPGVEDNREEDGDVEETDEDTKKDGEVHTRKSDTWDEVEMLKEKLEYIEKESIREKKEYDRRLVETEAALRESQSMKIVLEAQMNAQRKMFEENSDKMMEEEVSGPADEVDTSIEEDNRKKEEEEEDVEQPPHAQEEVLSAVQVSGETTMLTLPEEPSASDVDKEFEKLWLEVEQLKEESKFKEEELSKMEEHAETVTGERNDARLEQEQLMREATGLKEVLNEREKESLLLQKELAETKERLEEALVSNESLHLQRDELENQLMDSGNRSTANQEDEQILTSEIQSLKEELEETKDVISKEQNLFKEALEEEMSSSKDRRRENAGDEVQRLNELLDQKEQREKEILTEKNLQISVLQEASSRLADENEELLQELQDIKSRFVNSPDVSSSGFDGALDEEDLAGNGVDLAGRLDESVAREEMLRKEKDLLLEKVAEQDEIHRRLVTEREELQRQLSDKQRLEELLLEKDRLEQELSKQKRNMEGDLHDLEVQLTQRENHLLKEKCQLQNELKQKDLLLRRWEVGYREHQLKLRHQEMLLEKQYSEQLSKVQDDVIQGRTSHLENLRSEIEKRHAEAIARLRRDLHQEFALREARMNESHLSDISVLKSQHNAQVQWSSY